jgi:hypothetical protein
MCRVTAVEEDVVARTPLLRAQSADGEVRLTTAGAWTAPNAAELEGLVQGITSDASAAGAAAIDMCAIEHSTPMVRCVWKDCCLPWKRGLPDVHRRMNLVRCVPLCPIGPAEG